MTATELFGFAIYQDTPETANRFIQQEIKKVKRRSEELGLSWSLDQCVLFIRVMIFHGYWNYEPNHAPSWNVRPFLEKIYGAYPEPRLPNTAIKKWLDVEFINSFNETEVR